MGDGINDRIDGALDQTEAEGKVDQAQGDAKGVIADVKDKAGDLLKKVGGN